MQLFLMFNQGKIVLVSKIFSVHSFLAAYFLFCTLLTVESAKSTLCNTYNFDF